jgi:hypothetical protein
MTFEGDAFISYAHIDNVGVTEGQKGWVANLHRALETKVAQRLGRKSRIWRDPKLAGNDILSDALIEQIRSAATLVSVLSPGYVRSEWCIKELEEFCRTAGDLAVEEKARIFKVLKTPVPLEQHPPELQPLLGYEFFKIDPDTGRVRELDEMFGPDAERDFWLKLDDLVHDLCELLQTLDDPDAPAQTADGRGTVFLAETTSDLREQRDAIKRDLQQHGYTVLPSAPLPLSAAEASEAIRANLALCRMSVHMIGRNYSLVPEGGVASLLEVQNELAIERERSGGFSRLVWIPRGLKVADERQARVIQQLRMDHRIQEGADLLETSLEDLRTTIAEKLQDKPPAPAQADAPAPTVQVYLLYDQRDSEAVGPWADFLFNDFEVIHPVFSGDEAELRQYHEDNLRTCDGVMILHGAANEAWLRRKLAELQKSAGYGRTKARPEVAICLIPPRTPEKARFRTHQAAVIPQWEGLSAEPLRQFVSALKAKGEERQRDGAGDSI